MIGVSQYILYKKLHKSNCIQAKFSITNTFKICLGGIDSAFISSIQIEALKSENCFTNRDEYELEAK